MIAFKSLILHVWLLNDLHGYWFFCAFMFILIAYTDLQNKSGLNVSDNKFRVYLWFLFYIFCNSRSCIQFLMSYLYKCATLSCTIVQLVTWDFWVLLYVVVCFYFFGAIIFLSTTMPKALSPKIFSFATNVINDSCE